MFEFVPMLALLALVKKVVDLGRYAAGRDLNGVATQVVAWVAGAGAVMAFAASDWAALVSFGDLPLSKMGLVSQILAGMTVGSTASLVQDTFKAVDQGQSERKPTLL